MLPNLALECVSFKVSCQRIVCVYIYTYIYVYKHTCVIAISRRFPYVRFVSSSSGISNSFLNKPTRVAAPSPRASLGRRTVCGRTEQRRPPISKRYGNKVRMVWGSFIIAAAALKTPTRNGDNAQGVNLTFRLNIQSVIALSSVPSTY